MPRLKPRSSPQADRSQRHRSRWSPAVLGLLVAAAVLGCRDDTDLVRKIQSRRQAKQQLRSQQDHLGEAFALLRQFVTLEPDRARRQIAYHLNRWSERRPETQAEPPRLLATVAAWLSAEQREARVVGATYQPSDAEHLRDCFVFNRLYSWVDVESQDERLLADWLDLQADSLSAPQVDQLRTATRLFDWTVRNIALEPDQPNAPAPPGPDFPGGLQFRGPGYRQTDFQTLTRGTGDGLQRAGVFTQLCRQAGVPAAVLGTIDGQTGQVEPFCVGVLVGGEIYLFEPRLGIFVPGPGQVGIATLSQARQDPLVMRRLGIAGFDQFDYPLDKSDVQQCVALLNVLPETVSPRMERLQAGLTGRRRMNVYVNADRLAEQFDAVTGISGARLWPVPLQAELYQQTCRQFAQRDPVFGFWFLARWAMLEGDFEMAEKLELGRWRHLIGQFSDAEEENREGARSLYLAQRAPEFEIEDLRIDVELQKQYGIRRELGVDPEVYDQQVAQIQNLMRLGKRTATFWLSLLQADDGRLETALGWLEKRVLDDEQQSLWTPAARYNLARLAEALGQTERAIELYKRVGETQEHGNRIRARLLAKASNSDQSS